MEDFEDKQRYKKIELIEKGLNFNFLINLTSLIIKIL